MNKEEILKELAHKLEDKYGAPSGIFHELGFVLIKDASEPNAPIIPDDIAEIIHEIAEKYNLNTGDIAFSVNNGDILVGFPSNS